MTRSFGQRLHTTIEQRGRLCVGIDPHGFLLDAWDLPRTPAGLREFGLRVVDAASGTIGIVKPQVAFFEVFGSAGFAALEDVLAAARQAGLLVIADAKRGDIGSSVDAYGDAWLTPGSPLEADAVTLAAYAGTGSLGGVFDLALQHGKGAFVLAATSNPESRLVQTALVSADERADLTVAGLVATEIDEWNRQHAIDLDSDGDGSGDDDTPALGSIGVVLGATKNLLDYGVDVNSLADGAPLMPVLAPGFGHQGALFDDIGSIYGPLAAGTIVSTSRSALSAGPSALADTLADQAGQLSGALS
ncbi:orotidine 5'-phosphate decarboxylase [Agreia sp. Leaf244]|uniref:orotidine-5'-phosphate decarboxylase n=1 Tax=Agreia sp. Leaf244 TaxID=1736305 RepID=UPI0006FB71EA|nr:orotidine-5'-phosphate decarboxylase [Agreia sp. Leaf244]KQO06594.1 orotidine 5'-phosphate decarboxylase [Agreia sp. Leaf244]